ncbi:hypothetical protein P170DRAFT_508319 [Aspergillus steynii IBT 23096]|uniref:FAD-binding FR-type domain-containing protein n=1 Tax=Aspergillus steynii IBT 23096 TaxID=1392250 RepID=A0A2I2GB27_9EURO|nr:uncharacterized protein P170DRAFT_508319 [Aspergillus steynii IBT 23096]PLB50081.1 hypothetical protein P170DRAFT_508319 [Aspergillus steynii IBT 23096]
MKIPLQGWHPGELSIQRRLGFEDAVSESWRAVKTDMPEQHRLFHTSNLHFIPVTTLDEHGRPWASIVAGAGGNIGFVKSPDPGTLLVTARLWDGDPLLGTVDAWMEGKLSGAGRGSGALERFLTAGLGIEFSTRRRNKFAGRIKNIRPVGDLDVRFEMYVNEALGNCPKYINVRKLVPFAHARPQIAYRVDHLRQSQRLPEDVIDFITNADTVFIGSVYKSQRSTANKFPSHAGMNSRGGLPGFMRVRPSDGRTVVLPDYSGNRFVSSLGNIEATGLVGLTIVSLTTGDVLYLTGTAENLVGQDALRIMDRHSTITVVKVTGFTFVKDALPVRQEPGTPVERSPYSPKIKYLVEESGAASGESVAHRAELKSAMQLSDDLAVLRFKVLPHEGASKLRIRPGQAIVLDFMNWIGPPQYHHMMSTKPSLLNDDRVRTWTVSSAHEADDVSWFELTMRELKGGAVTGALFDVLGESNKDRGSSFAPVKAVVAEIVGVTGNFYLSPTAVNVLWVAGGIGITPFLAMLQALSTREHRVQSDVTLALATREPDIMMEVLKPLLANLPPEVRLTIDIFMNVPDFRLNLTLKDSQSISVHHGRIPAEYWTDTAGSKDVLICGPNGFGDSAMEGLQAAGVPLQKIQREGFY